MNILVDVGNTNAKWRAYDQVGVIFNEGAVATERIHSLVDVWRDYTKLGGISVVLASVKEDAFNLSFKCKLEAELRVTPSFVVVERECAGVEAAYSDLTQLGVDRWLGLIAAHNLYLDCHKVIVSAGSALTADYLAVNGKHLGGLIAPGVGMMRSALNFQTDRAKTQEGPVDSCWKLGRSTEECVNSGIVSMCEGWADQLVAQAVNQFSDQKPIKVLVFGGDAPLICEMLNGKARALLSVFMVESMVLSGLEKIVSIQKP